MSYDLCGDFTRSSFPLTHGNNAAAIIAITSLSFSPKEASDPAPLVHPLPGSHLLSCSNSLILKQPSPGPKGYDLVAHSKNLSQFCSYGCSV